MAEYEADCLVAADMRGFGKPPVHNGFFLAVLRRLMNASAPAFRWSSAWVSSKLVL